MTAIPRGSLKKSLPCSAKNPKYCHRRIILFSPAEIYVRGRKQIMRVIKKILSLSYPKRKPIQLHGGRKAVQAKSIRRKGYLGGRGEGRVFEVEVVIEGKGKERKLVLAEKEFYKRLSFFPPRIQEPGRAI
jgi:hypothetical protein